MARQNVVYTALFGGYDCLLNPREVSDNCDYICFTDRPDLCGGIWRCVLVDSSEESPALLNRKYKIRPHRFLSEYAKSLYIDSNILIKMNVDPIFEYLRYGVLFAPDHPIRDCIFDELDACYRSGKITLGARNALHDFFVDCSYPVRNGLSENGILLRLHNDSRVIGLMDDWWDFVSNLCARDQISFRFLAWQHGLTVGSLKYSCRRPNRFFAYRSHLNTLRRSTLRSFAKFVSDRRADNWAFYGAATIADRIKRAR